MRSNLIIAFSQGVNALSVHEMVEALREAQEQKNRNYPCNYWDIASYVPYEGCMNTYAIPEGVEIDMRVQKITNMPINERGDFIKLYLPKDWDKK